MAIQLNKKIFLFLLLVFMLPSVADAATIGRPANALGLVGYWSMDGSQINWTTNRMSDSSGQGNTGQLINLSTTTSSAVGKIGQSLNFNGSDSYVNVGDIPPLINATFSAWVNISLLDGSHRSFVSKRATGGTEMEWQFGLSSGLNNLKLSFATDGGVNCCTDVTEDTTTLSTGKWTHVVATFDASADRLQWYVDGIPTETDVATLNFGTNTAYVATIGATREGTAEHFPGAIDDLRIYSRALSAAEVAALYNSGSAGVGRTSGATNSPLTKGLVGHWPFDGGRTNWATGQTQDLSGQGTIGQLINLATTTAAVAGKVGQAFKFNGTSSYVSVANSTPVDLISNFSVGVWFKLSADFNSSSAVSQPIVTKYVDDNNNLSITLRGTDYAAGSGSAGQIQLKIENPSGNGGYFHTTRASWAANTWYHVLGVFGTNGSTATVYVNGVEDRGGSSDLGGASSGSINAYWGWGEGRFDVVSNLASVRYFDGVLDDARIYNRKLSAEEVKQLYTTGSATAGQSSGAANSPLSSGLVGYWDMNGASINWSTNQMIDRGGQDNTGQLLNMSTTTSPIAGKIGQALMFDGDTDVIQVTDSTPLDISGPMAVSMWFKLNSAAGEYDGLLMKTTSSSWTDGYGIYFSDDAHLGGVPSLTFFVTGWDSNAGYTPFSYTTDFAWHHVVGVYDGSAVRLYLDGVEGVPDAYSGAVTTNNGRLIISKGESSTETNYTSPATIDDVRVYNRALTASEVKQLYNSSR